MHKDRRRESQHYVPKILLRPHASNLGAKRGKERIWVYDKKTDRKFETNIKGVAAEFEHNDLVIDGHQVSTEALFGKLESHVGPILDRIIRCRSLTNVTSGERVWLAFFLAAQHVRTEQFRINILKLNEAISEKITKMGHDPSRVEGFRVMGKEDAKIQAALFLRTLKEFAPLFLDKAWMLFESPITTPFFIGDNPLTLQNERDFGPYGNLGFALPGIEIYLPLSPTLSLALWEKSNLVQIADQLRQAEEATSQVISLKLLTLNNPGLTDASLSMGRSAIAYCKSILSSAESGTSALLSPDVVIRLNSLQVMFSARFVMCWQPSFRLVQKMISDSEEYRGGLGPTVT